MKSHVSENSQTSINEWFMGKSEGLVPNKTVRITRADPDRTPYRTFHKYRAEILKTSNGPSNSEEPAEPAPPGPAPDN